MRVFQNWCASNSVSELPAAPADVARFVSDCFELGMAEIWPMLQEISRAHYLIGLADPTQGGPVAAAIAGIAKIDPPRAWPKEHKASFSLLPYNLQSYLAGHEARREKEIRRAQNEAADAKKKLAALQPESPVGNLLEQRKQTNGIYATQVAR